MKKYIFSGIGIALVLLLIFLLTFRGCTDDPAAEEPLTQISETASPILPAETETPAESTDLTQETTRPAATEKALSETEPEATVTPTPEEATPAAAAQSGSTVQTNSGSQNAATDRQTESDRESKPKDKPAPVVTASPTASPSPTPQEKKNFEIPIILKKSTYIDPVTAIDDPESYELPEHELD